MQLINTNVLMQQIISVVAQLNQQHDWDLCTLHVLAIFFVFSEFFGLHEGVVSFLPCLRLVDQRPSIGTFRSIHLSYLISLGFPVLVELEKQSYCDLKVTNNTESYVAFKVCFIWIFQNLTIALSHFLRLLQLISRYILFYFRC